MSLSQRGLTRVIATFFGVGYLPVLPATWASLAAVFLAWLAYDHLLYWCLALIAAGLWACGDARAALGSDDPPPFVMDEVCGMALTVLFLPKTVVVFAVGFLLFTCYPLLTCLFPSMN